MAAQRSGVSTWPEQWRWDDDRVEIYRARGMSGVGVEEVVVDGLSESGLLLPVRQPPKWQGTLYLLMGFIFLAIAAMLLVQTIVLGEWIVLAAVGIFVLIGGVCLVAAYRGLFGRRGNVPGLVLTPTRVIHRGVAGDLLAVAWSDIAEVRPYVSGPGTAKWENVFGIDVRDPEAFRRAAGLRRRRRAGSQVVMVTDAAMLMNPLLAYHLVCHYLAHPDERQHICLAAGGGR